MSATQPDKTFARYSKNLGRYNICGNEKSWCLTLYTSGGDFNQIWPEEDEPDVDGFLPSEVMAVLRERLDAFLFISGREQTRARMDAWMAESHKYDLAWLQNQIDKHERQLRALRLQVDDVEESALLAARQEQHK